MDERTAVISNDGLYRYRLTRRWSEGGRMATFVMLNPSTADASVDDPTIIRCTGFAKREDCDGLVVNLYGYRATKPAALRLATDPVGPDNVSYVRSALDDAHASDSPIITAWGANSTSKDTGVVSFYRPGELRLLCLGVTKDGHPRHPLYLRSDTPLDLWLPATNV